jgi:uncharacterized membrane protein
MRMVGEGAVDEYLARLERSMSDLPSSRRSELVEEIKEHIEEAVAELEPGATEADVRNALERLGEPEDIANEARERLGIRPLRVSWTDTAAIVLLLVGGFLWGIGWIVGVVFLWQSDVWSVRDKVIGTLVVPGGLATSFLFLFLFLGARLFDVYGETFCSASRSIMNGVRQGTSSCTSSGTHFLALGIALGILLVLVVGQIVTSAYLGRKLRRARQAQA